MKVGVDYYPEHWEPSMWAEDAQRMQEAGISLVRLAEFAWSRLEPREDEFDFAWLDDAIDVLARYGMQIVLGTPTATPPNWLVEKYPDVLPVDSKKQPVYQGVRWHRCYNSPSLRRRTEVIVNRLTRHYANHPALVGWQTDNELQANDCHCESCTTAFRRWVQKKYGSLENVNREWGTVVWSGEYSSWSQLITPLGGSPHQNPSFLLDFQRFSSDSVADFNQFQADLIRANSPQHFVTHNVWGYPVVTDYYDLFESMDFAAVDYYPSTDLKDDSKARIYHGPMTLDLTRGIKQKNFWVMEQLSGTPGCWNPMSRTPFPGMIRAHAWQAVSRGADAIVHFRWRSARLGAEQFWHGLLDHHGLPGRRFAEFKQFSSEARQLSSVLEGTEVKNDVALLYSHEQHNAFKIQPQSDGFDYLTNFRSLHKPFVRHGVGTDVINWTADISRYKLVVAPMLFLESESVAEKFHHFVEAGGTLVLTTRTGVKNINNVCQPTRLPGLLTQLAGVVVDEYDPVGKDTQILTLAGKAPVACAQWCDVVEAITAETVGHYASEFYSGRSAITKNRFGKGSVYYIGTVLDDDGSNELIGSIIRELCLPQAAQLLPEGVEMACRGGKGYTVRFLMNLTKARHSVVLGHSENRDVLTGEVITGKATLEPGAVRIYIE